jgi:signal transduction histidine kinase
MVVVCMPQRCTRQGCRVVGRQTVCRQSGGVRLANDDTVSRQADAQRIRAVNPLFAEVGVALVFAVLGIVTVLSQDLVKGQVKPGGLAVVTTIAICAPIVIRRRLPLLAVGIASIGIVIHIGADYPEGSLPLAVLFLTYSVAAWSPTRPAFAGLAVVCGSIAVLGFSSAPGLDVFGVAGNILLFTVAWATGFAMRARRETLEARIGEAEERAKLERQSAARMVAEERLRIAQELHDVVAHSMSVIAVQAGVGAHVLQSRPDQALAALEAIAATSRGTLTEMRRLLGVLRDDDGNRSHAPAPGISDVAQLVDDVRAAGVPVTLALEGTSDGISAGVELSAYRVVQEALTNVIKHAGSPSRVDVSVRQRPGSLTVEVVDDGRGAAATALRDGAAANGHGLLGMRERVELWGGELTVGPIPGGGYGVKALLPYGEIE